VQFKIDENGILEALARDVSKGTDTIIRIESSAVNVEDSAVEAMVSESIEHAFTDMAERVFTEAKMKAEELLPAVDAVLQNGLAMDDERDEIEAAAAAVRAALEGGAANPLKSAVQRLDAATETLAARLVEQAMDAALERKISGN
jgi:molecular chaperone DnaK